MAGDVHIVRCIRCGGELEYNRTYDKNGDLWIDVVQCPKCVKNNCEDEYWAGYNDGYSDAERGRKSANKEWLTVYWR